MAATGVGQGGSGGRAEGRVKGVTFEDVGHLIAMEAVERTAVEISTWLDGEVGRWKKQEDEWEVNWRPKTLREKQDLDDRWKDAMGGDPRAKKKSKL